MKRFFTVITCLIIVFTLACKKTGSTSTCSYDACAYPAPDSEIAKIQTYLDTSKITTAVKHCSGIYYQMLTEGTGGSPTPCSSVLINYKGYLTNKTVFDSSSSPVSFNLMSLIDGWKRGVPLAKRGGKIRLFIPPSLGYGPNAYGPIPGKSILIFDIELLDYL